MTIFLEQKTFFGQKNIWDKKFIETNFSVTPKTYFDQKFLFLYFLVENSVDIFLI